MIFFNIKAFVLKEFLEIRCVAGVLANAKVVMQGSCVMNRLRRCKISAGHTWDRRLSENSNFFSKSRHTKKITAPVKYMEHLTG